MDAMLTWAASRFNVPFAEILVDTVRSGYSASTDSMRTRVLSANDIAAARIKHGFEVRQDERGVVRCVGQRCIIEGGTMLLAFDAPEIAGTSATMRVAITKHTKIRAAPGVDPATVGEDRVGFTLFKLTLRHLGSTWQVERAEVVALR